jgi:signal transduction histidine kinase
MGFVVKNGSKARATTSGGMPVPVSVTQMQMYAKLHPGVEPGQYICICVTDTGTGMPPDVVARAFGQSSAMARQVNLH